MVRQLYTFLSEPSETNKLQPGMKLTGVMGHLGHLGPWQESIYEGEIVNTRTGLMLDTGTYGMFAVHLFRKFIGPEGTILP